MNKHATIKLGGYDIPLIGIQPDATLQECAACNDVFSIQDVELVETQFLCKKCRINNDNQSNPPVPV